MIKSPCNNVCRYDNDMICISCKRSLDEVSLWDKTNDKGKKEILKNISNRKKEGEDYYGFPQ